MISKEIFDETKYKQYAGILNAGDVDDDHKKIAVVPLRNSIRNGVLTERLVTRDNLEQRVSQHE